MTREYDKRTPSHPGRIDIAVKEFDNLIEDQGTRVRITPTIFCPRRSGKEIEESDANHDLNCPLCSGSLLIDIAAEAYETWAYIAGVKLEQVFQPQSRFDLKDAMMTVKGTDRIAPWFKTEAIDFATLFNQVVLRGRGDTDKLRYAGQDPTEVVGASYSLIDNDGAAYTRGDHFTVSGDTLTWVGSSRPPAGKLYSILYPVVPTFRVIDLVHDTRFYYDGFKKPKKTPFQLPQQAHIRWDYLAKRGHDVPLGE